ncbi:MAG: NYN domain-containing protein [Candidatus Pacebacteria bacterium]|nr:NYN domain-containing protein [Candidatus Paceibacterota bacterium]
MNEEQIKKEIKRYAFIDVPNTNGTTKNLHNFSIDWKKLYELLTNKKWNCCDVFFYKGYKGKKEKAQLEKMEEDIGYKIRTKFTHIHKDKEEEIQVKCDECDKEFLYTHKINGARKSNCDVELTVDAVNFLSEGDEALIFTGDGDFAYLIDDLVEKGIVVYVISSQKRDKYGNKRFSTRLGKIIKEEEKNGNKRVVFIPINNWNNSIKKENRHEA